MSVAVVSQAGIATGATTKTLLMVTAGAASRLLIKEWSVSFAGIDAAAVPIQVQLCRFTTAGTFTAATPRRTDESMAAIVATGGHTATAEPTAGDILGEWYVTPAGGLWAMQYPLGDELVVGLSGRLGIRTIAPATVLAACTIKFAE